MAGPETSYFDRSQTRDLHVIQAVNVKLRRRRQMPEDPFLKFPANFTVAVHHFKYNYL